MSRVASGLSVAGAGSVTHKIKYDKVNLADLQIDRLIHLEQSQSRMCSTRKMNRQSNKLSDSFHAHSDTSKLIFHVHAKTVSYYLQTNLPTLFAEPGAEILHALLNDNDYFIKDGKLKDNITHGQRQLI